MRRGRSALVGLRGPARAARFGAPARVRVRRVRHAGCLGHAGCVRHAGCLRHAARVGESAVSDVSNVSVEDLPDKQVFFRFRVAKECPAEQAATTTMTWIRGLMSRSRNGYAD